MKFGKHMARACAMAPAEWYPGFVNYKLLKSLCRQLAESARRNGAFPRSRCCSGRSECPAPEQARAMAADDAERHFFRCLVLEVQRCAAFFSSIEAELPVRLARLETALQLLRQQQRQMFGAPVLMGSAINLYKDALLLEDFAVVNYLAISKALKKHDKVSGYDTRERFMRNVVNRQPFAWCPRVQSVLTRAEAIFRVATGMVSTVPPPAPAREAAAAGGGGCAGCGCGTLREDKAGCPRGGSSGSGASAAGPAAAAAAAAAAVAPGWEVAKPKPAATDNGYGGVSAGSGSSGGGSGGSGGGSSGGGSSSSSGGSSSGGSRSGSGGSHHSGEDVEALAAVEAILQLKHRSFQLQREEFAGAEDMPPREPPSQSAAAVASAARVMAAAAAPARQEVAAAGAAKRKQGPWKPAAFPAAARPVINCAMDC